MKIKKVISLLLFSIIAASMCAVVAFASDAGNNIASANQINFGTQYSDSITESDSKDFYKFTLANSGNIKIKLSANIHITRYYILNSAGEIVWESGTEYWNNSTQFFNAEYNVDLLAGTYYFEVEQSVGTGNYNFTVNYTDAKESFKETSNGTKNNTLDTASEISFGKTYIGQIAENDSKDFYKFTFTGSENIKIKLSANIHMTRYYILDSAGGIVWESGTEYWNNSTQLFNTEYNVDLLAGTYYFEVEQSVGTGNYNFMCSLPMNYTLGDVDNDGKISAADARLALRASVGLKGDKDVHGFSINSDDKTSRAFKAANVDFDDKISAADARLILRASVGLEDPKDWKKA